MKDLVRNKCLISEFTSNTNGDCDRMFMPEFMETLNYVKERLKRMNGTEE